MFRDISECSTFRAALIVLQLLLDWEDKRFGIELFLEIFVYFVLYGAHFFVYVSI